MKNTKKILARETLIFFSFIILVVLFYCGTRVWNWNQRSKIQSLKSNLEIINKNIFFQDSVMYSFGNANTSSLYSYAIKKGYYSKSYYDFIEHCSTDSVITNVYNILKRESVINYSYADFKNTFFNHFSSIGIFIQSRAEINKAENDKYFTKSTINAYESTLIYGAKTKAIMTKFTITIFAIMYLLRGFFIGTKWAIKTIKE